MLYFPLIKINIYRAAKSNKIEYITKFGIPAYHFHLNSNESLNGIEKNIIIKKLIILFLIISLTLILFLYFKIPDYQILDNITYKENFTRKNKSLKKGKKYIDLCLKGKLINDKRFELSNNPKITIIIPFYKTGKLIHFIIRSIQNQNIKDIEILLINDFSNDNNKTIKIIEKLKENDSRIILLNNKKNMGILYSRCIGVLNAKGEYIMNLDHDDLIFDNNVLETAYKSAKIGNFDIISFMYIKSQDYNCKIKDMRPREYNIPHNYIVTQPILSSYPLFQNDTFSYFDYTIWAKLFKKLIYTKAVNILTFDRYSVFNAYNEDLIGLFTICNVAEKYKYIRKYGVFHRYYNTSSSFIAPKEKRIFDDIFFSEIILDIGKKQFKKYGAIFLDLKVQLSSKNNNNYLLRVINKILDIKYIELKYKKKIKLKFQKLKIK